MGGSTGQGNRREVGPRLRDLCRKGDVSDRMRERDSICPREREREGERERGGEREMFWLFVCF